MQDYFFNRYSNILNNLYMNAPKQPVVLHDILVTMPRVIITLISWDNSGLLLNKKMK